MIGRVASGRGASGRAAVGRVGNWKHRPVSRREPAGESWTKLGGRVAGVAEPVFSLVSRRIQVSRWVLDRVSVVYPVLWFKWQTANDERTCPECGAMHGRAWHEQQVMPTPPLHVNCRCQVTLARTEWRVRYVPTWRLRSFTRQEWEWTRTSWA